ncbi:hypothetical protein ABK040_016796 [Willaertia magna]
MTIGHQQPISMDVKNDPILDVELQAANNNGTQQPHNDAPTFNPTVDSNANAYYTTTSYGNHNTTHHNYNTSSKFTINTPSFDCDCSFGSACCLISFVVIWCTVGWAITVIFFGVGGHFMAQGNGLVTIEKDPAAYVFPNNCTILGRDCYSGKYSTTCAYYVSYTSIRTPPYGRQIINVTPRYSSSTYSFFIQQNVTCYTNNAETSVSIDPYSPKLADYRTTGIALLITGGVLAGVTLFSWTGIFGKKRRR